MKISVIVPAYNSEAFLGETLESLRAQTWQDWEAVAVNDGSTDGTAAVLDAFCAKDRRIRCIFQENAGVSAARNRGLEAATGDYVVFLDADDLLEPQALAAFAAAAEKSGADVVLGRLRFFENGKKGAFHAAADALAGSACIETFDKRLLWNFLVCNKCYRRTLLLAHGVRFPVSGFSEEGAFFMDAVFSGATLAGTPDSVALYRRHTQTEGASVSQTANEKNLLSLDISMRHIYAAAQAALQNANRADEAYLQEILYKHLHILVSQFYRALWRMDEAALSLCAAQITSLYGRLPAARRTEICRANPDLMLEQVCASHAQAAAQPMISVCVARACSPGAVEALFAQTAPLFELLLSPQAAQALPPNLLALPNVHVAASFAPKGRRTVRLRTLPCLDAGTLQQVCRAGLPASGAVLRAVSALLKWRHRR